MAGLSTGVAHLRDLAHNLTRCQQFITSPHPHGLAVGILSAGGSAVLPPSLSSARTVAEFRIVNRF